LKFSKIQKYDKSGKISPKNPKRTKTGANLESKEGKQLEL